MTGVHWPNLVQAAVFLVMLLLATIAIFYMIVSLILRKIGKAQKPRKPDDLALLYFAAFTFLALGTICSLFALAGVTPTMLMIEIGPYGPENFNWGRWMVQDGIFFLMCGILALGFAYIIDKTKQWKAEKKPKQSSQKP